MPHVHVPVAEHASATTTSHVAQAAPFVPQRDSDGGVEQTPPRQQPFGQLVALPTQVPPWHVWPTWHAGAPPQVQAPVAEHASADAGLQATHVEPFTPHFAAVGGVAHWFP